MSRYCNKTFCIVCKLIHQQEYKEVTEFIKLRRRHHLPAVTNLSICGDEVQP